MENTQIPEDFTPRNVAADLIYMSGGTDPDFVQITEIVADNFAEYDIYDEDTIEKFALEVDRLISSATVTVTWADAEAKYVFNEKSGS